jgi:putative thiamine transport system permease protein
MTAVVAPSAVRPSGRRDALMIAPALTLALCFLPIAAGLIGTVLPAFGWLPALNAEEFGIGHWRVLLAAPELPGALRLTLVSGGLAAFATFAVAILFCAALHDRPGFRRMQSWLTPLLAVPHAAMAIGLAFLLSPGGWILRLLSPWATGSSLPPGDGIVNDPEGIGLTIGLLVKELPYLLFMILAALSQIHAERYLAAARSLGYGPMAAWFKVILPQVYPLIRLPVFAVLAYSLSVVDMALLLGPSTPPPFAVLILRWFNDPDLTMRLVAAAAALLHLGVVAAAILLWMLGEQICRRLFRAWLTSGRRGSHAVAWRELGALPGRIVFLLSAAALLALILWTFSARWPFPDALPRAWTLDNWRHQAMALGQPLATSLTVGLATALAALGLTLACLENEQRRGLHPTQRLLWLLYLPLLLPQISFLFGFQVQLVWLGADGSWLAVAWSHLLFVLPYVFLSLEDSYRALDERYARSALCLGAPPSRVFWRVKLPLLRRPVATAAAIGFAVSMAQYLPTLFAGGGRWPTLTTEAVALTATADRRVIAVAAVLQALLPLLAFAAVALWAPARARRVRP